MTEWEHSNQRTYSTHATSTPNQQRRTTTSRTPEHPPTPCTDQSTICTIALHIMLFTQHQLTVPCCTPQSHTCSRDARNSRFKRTPARHPPTTNPQAVVAARKISTQECYCRMDSSCIYRDPVLHALYRELKPRLKPTNMACTICKTYALREPKPRTPPGA